MVVHHREVYADTITDCDITTRLKEAADALGISLLDHLILSSAGYFSFVEQGLLDAPVPE
jgi:DNA repair protein RadC